MAGAAGRHRVRGKDGVPLQAPINSGLKNSFLPDRADAGRCGKEL
jgi:hypothetical protein